MQRLIKQRNLKKLYKPPSQQNYAENYKKLVIVILISFAFIAGQLIAGIISHSIAIISDAIHLISDTIGFFTSFLFLYLSRWRPNEKMTFGYHRMELLGAIANIFIIWVLIFFVLYESTNRIIDKEFVEEPMIMLITAGGGLIVNIVMYKILHNGSNHSHGLLSEGCAHDHAHQHEAEHIVNQRLPNNGSRTPKISKSMTEPQGLNMTEQQCLQDICQDSDCNISIQILHCHKNSDIHRHQSVNAKLPPLKKHQSQKKIQGQIIIVKSQKVEVKNNIEEILIEKYCQEDHQHSNSCYLSPQIIKPVHQYNRQVRHKQLHKEHNGETYKSNSLKQGPKEQATLDFVNNILPQPRNINAHQHQHSHKCSHIQRKEDRNPSKNQHQHQHQGFNGHGHQHSHKCSHIQRKEDKNPSKNQHQHQHQGFNGHGHNHVHNQQEDERNASIGMQAAILHALSDMIMSVGLIISATFIFFFGNPGKAYNEKVTQWNPWHLFDPVSTYLFSIIALASTVPVVRNAYYLLMETTPTYINLIEIRTKCEQIDGVINIHDIHVWDLKPGKTCMIAHVLVRKGTERNVLVELSDLARHNKIFHSTFQIQEQEWKDEDSYILCDHNIH